MVQERYTAKWLRLLLILPVCSLSAIVTSRRHVCAGESAPKASVTILKNLHYYQGKDAVPTKHNLDIYLPAGKRNFPVVFYVHGGGWIIGDKNQFGVPGRLGISLARSGIAMVSVNYRLSPKVKHPAHIRDVARAFAWTVQHLPKYGGCMQDVFVCGHSAGAHLISLLATNERFLKEQGQSIQRIRGAIPISGVYQITSERVFTEIFGTDPALLKDASPLYHVSEDTPPFMILCAERELPKCEFRCANGFCLALKRKNVDSHVLRLEDRNHVTIWYNAPNQTDPVFQALTSFIMSRVALRRLGAEGVAGVDVLREFLTTALPSE